VFISSASGGLLRCSDQHFHVADPAGFPSSFICLRGAWIRWMLKPLLWVLCMLFDALSRIFLRGSSCDCSPMTPSFPIAYWPVSCMPFCWCWCRCCCLWWWWWRSLWLAGARDSILDLAMCCNRDRYACALGEQRIHPRSVFLELARCYVHFFWESDQHAIRA